MQITITNGTLTQVQETLTPDTNYTLPTTISVSGATSNYNNSTGAITLTNLTQTMSITANGESTVNPSISIGTSALAKAFVGNTEIASIWLGNVKLYEGTPAPSGYSGDINSYETVPILGANKTKIKFDTPPTSDNDYDSYVDIRGELTGLTSYQNKTKIYIWWDSSYDNYDSIVRINGITYNGGSNYSQATEVLLTGNYDIELGYSRSGGSSF